jgi:serine/threonine-protein kinase
MDTRDWDRIKDLFAEALDRPAAERESYLKETSGHRPDLVREVRSLLAASSESVNVIESNGFDLASELAAGHSATDRRFGPYRILREIGSGGMGTVFLAERDDGEFAMQVALKIVRQSVAEHEIVERFKRERQILAGLRHPNIAALHDGGISDRGEPFLAMEYVDGETLLHYAASRSLSVPDRLRLFLKVCSAVAHAHRNLVVHRDLKPSNILVADDGEPKLLDFGLARSFDSSDAAVHTTLRAFTPAYASPEQITGGAITTGSDIYSLGVILYELLTGAKPLEVENKSYEQIVRTVLEKEPLPPSEAAARHETGGRKLRGDLDNIVMMGLRKEPERRYGSVEQLAADIAAHLADRPVAARPSTLGYRTAKFAQRNRLAVAAAALILIAVIGGFAASLWQARIARRQSERSEAVNRLMSKMLMTAMPEAGAGGRRGEQATMTDILVEVERNLESDLASEPEVRSQLRQLIGDVYLTLGRYDEASRNLGLALADQAAIFGPDAAATVKTEMSLASLYFARADYDRATEIYTRRLGVFRDQFRRGNIDLDFYLTKLIDYATICRARGDAAAAEAVLNETIAEAEAAGKSASVEQAKLLLTLILLDQGRFTEAKAYQLALAAKRRSEVGPDDAAMAPVLTLLGSIQMEDGDLAEATGNLEEAEAVYRKNYAPDFLPLHDNLRLQAQAAYLAGDLTRAQRLITGVLEAYRKTSNPQYISFATALTIDGLVRIKLKDYQEAERVLTEAVRLRNENLPPGHFMTALSLGALGECLLAQRKYAEAETPLAESYDSLKASQGEANPRTQLAKSRLECMYRERDQAAPRRSEVNYRAAGLRQQP